MAGRDIHIDNAKGVLIILVVLGHLIWPLPNADRWADALYFFIYFFHMPMFALVSGYLSRDSFSRASLASSAKQLIAPYLVFSGIQWGLLKLLGQEPHGLHMGQYGLWFLLSLFCWRLLLPVMKRVPYGLAVSICVALTCGFVPFIRMEWSLSRTLVFMPFFLAGYMLRQRNRSIMACLGAPAAWGVILGLGGLALFLSRWDFHIMLYGAFPYGELGPAPMVGFIGRSVWYVLAFGGLAVLALVPRHEGWLTSIGRHSLHVYLLHSPLLVLYRAWPDGYGFLGSAPLVMLPAAVLLAWILSRPPVVRATALLVSPLASLK